EQVRRHFQPVNFGEVGMPGGIEPAREQLLDMRAAIFAWRQADAVHDDQLRRHSGGTRIGEWRFHEANALDAVIGYFKSHARSLTRRTAEIKPPACPLRPQSPHWRPA